MSVLSFSAAPRGRVRGTFDGRVEFGSPANERIRANERLEAAEPPRWCGLTASAHRATTVFASVSML
ncbi:hypothetical protein C2R22_04410 [Salinigranum rubrum]|uniref:Uncharacterized protein n=1 Tax=Salinigranum rubrum TaxID=755307 RepID=A0A2I8VGI2_9EURY|nr:hypothetical protein C2R22_04410 [Salinigranum rubrum]